MEVIAPLSLPICEIKRARKSLTFASVAYGNVTIIALDASPESSTEFQFDDAMRAI